MQSQWPWAAYCLSCGKLRRRCGRLFEVCGIPGLESETWGNRKRRSSMKRLSRFRMPRIFCGVFVAFAIAATAWAAGPCFKCKHEPVVMPVSLAMGTTVRTPEFLVKKIEYFIGIRVNRGLSFNQLSCMMGGNRRPSHCEMFHFDLVLDAEWKVLDGERIVAQGTAIGSNGDMAWSDSFMDRRVGEFVGEANKKYVVEVKFTKDGTSLDEFKPRLVVRMADSWN